MGYKAAIPIASGLAFVPAGATEPIVLHPSKGTVRGRPFVDYYNLRVVYHPNVYDWMPTPSWLAWLGKMPPKGTVLEFIRRPEHPLGNKYPYRAVAQQRLGGGTDIRVFVDETETPDSVKWLVLHELAHVLVTAEPTLAETLRAQPRPPGYPHDDDAHEAVLEEKLANTFADRLAPVPGLDRRWWRKRVEHRMTLTPPSTMTPPSTTPAPSKTGYGETGLVLPSASSAGDFVMGVEGSFPRLVGHMLGRAALIGTGVYLAGAGDKTVRYALAGSAAIETFVLFYAWKTRPR
jgi:hypothetical protein